jgi:anion-transporting  ArsA/GET3 family ATPase
MPPILSQLADRRLLVVTGKGGVGKSAIAAALAVLLSEQGQRVLLLEVDPRENAHQMLGLPPSGGELTPAGERLWLQNLKPREALDRIIRERVKIGMLADRVLASPIYHHLSEGMPGLRQLALLEHARRWSADGEGDLVVLDAPATGHGVSLLEAPRLITEVIEQGPIGEMAADLARLVMEPAACGVIVVTLAEEMPVQESLELAASLRQRLGRGPELLVVNGLYPPTSGRGAKSAAKSAVKAAAGPLGALWLQRRAINDRELARLAAEWDGPRLDLPLLQLARGPALAAELARTLELRDEAAS